MQGSLLNLTKRRDGHRKQNASQITSKTEKLTRKEGKKKTLLVADVGWLGVLLLGCFFSSLLYIYFLLSFLGAFLERENRVGWKAGERRCQFILVVVEIAEEERARNNTMQKILKGKSCVDKDKIG